MVRDQGWGDVLDDLEPTPEEDEHTEPELAAPKPRVGRLPPFPEEELPTLPMDPASVQRAFESSQLVRTLDAASAPTQPAAPAPSDWREYREPIAAGVLAVMVLGGAITWQMLARPDDGTAEPTSPPPRPLPVRTTTPPTEPGPGSSKALSPPPTREPAIEPEPEPQPKKAAIPMVSIVTKPPGALVEIDGIVYDRTPLIMQAPRDQSSLSVELRLDNHRTWKDVVRPNSAGHFNVNVELVPF